MGEAVNSLVETRDSEKRRLTKKFNDCVEEGKYSEDRRSKYDVQFHKKSLYVTIAMSPEAPFIDRIA